MSVTKTVDIKNIAEWWKDQYCRNGSWGYVFTRNRRSAEDIHISLLSATSLDQVDTIIGNTSWTTNHCSECGKDSRKAMVIFDVNGGEYGHIICKKCLKKALKELETS